MHGDDLVASRRQGAGLVEHDYVDAAGGFEGLCIAEQSAHAGGASGSGGYCGGGCEAEGAGAGDYEHGDRCYYAAVDGGVGAECGP